MISILANEFNFLNLLMVSLQIVLCLIMFLIAYTYISDDQSKWYNNLDYIAKNNIIKGNKGMFLGAVAFFFTGVASVVILDYYIRDMNLSVDEEKFYKKSFTNLAADLNHSSLHFYLFPLMVLLSILGLPIAFQTHNFITHVVFLVIALILNIYLMFFYMKTVTYFVSILLIPLLIWQIFSIALYAPGVISK